MRGVTILTAALLLAACGDDAAGGNGAASRSPAGPTAFENSVAALAPAARDAMFLRAIRDANHDCQGVTEAKLIDRAADGSPIWLARCLDKATYAVVLRADGTAEVTGAR